MISKLIRTVLIALFAAPVFAVTIGELQPGGGTVASRGTGVAPRFRSADLPTRRRSSTVQTTAPPTPKATLPAMMER